MLQLCLVYYDYVYARGFSDDVFKLLSSVSETLFQKFWCDLYVCISWYGGVVLHCRVSCRGIIALNYSCHVSTQEHSGIIIIVIIYV